MTERAAPSLVDLAHAAEQANGLYVDAVDKACSAVDTSIGLRLLAVDTSRAAADAAFLALHAAMPPSSAEAEKVYRMRRLILRGIVRPEWGLRVVQIAAAEQARKEAGDG